MFPVRHVTCAALLGLAAWGGLTAHAQQIYRIVGPDGRVTFSDRAPGESAKVTTVGAGGTAANTASLPFELRNAASRYPVTLYAGPECGPCSQGRSFLNARGIPFTERTVSSAEDIEALQRLSGTPRLPLLTIGGQQLKGYAESEWTQFLDAAGYPKTSQLPGGYRNPAATPLVAVQPQQAPVAPAPQARAPQPESVDTPAPSNPAGIRF